MDYRAAFSESEFMTETFCGGTGEPVRGSEVSPGLYATGALGQLKQAGGLGQPIQEDPDMEEGYEVAAIYREARDKILAELKVQVEVNRRLARDLMEARLELARLKASL
jgi:hypothetical protein